MEKKQILIARLAGLGGLLIALLLAPFSATLDLSISSFFYTDHHFVSSAFTNFVFKYGEALGFCVGGISSACVLLSFFLPKLRPYQAGALLVSLTWILGAGLLINTLLKDHWGRPRPKQITEFGGQAEFRPFYLPDFNSEKPHKSFPSGHASTGFYYFSILFLGIRTQRKWIIYLGLSLAMGLGILLSICRISQGGHFFTDTLFSALFMYWVILFVDWLVFEKLKRRTFFKKS